ncbi:TIGR02117 family protein [Pontibacter cellulosilyticus]|uniref:TIGR02117 family protein n=1 Tax=Pontibacter cellulosilyticus TaxID=1720253 RepID=A0A923SNP8_9BACT|nr:TIGR02117 family protein [Pontibacter cellulosilyticus]MBC5993400.1 TIGR02117 family protein [Pontibacter cellulosilyticus]
MQQILIYLLRILGKIVTFLADFVVLFFAAGFILSSFPVNSSFAQTTEPDSIEVYVTSNGVHTDIIVPVVTPYIDWRTKVPLHHFGNVDSTYSYLAFGWGDRRFYMETPKWGDLKPGVAMSAAFWPTRTAMHLEYIKNRLEPNRHQRPILISPAQYKNLITYINKSFQKKNGNYMHISNSGYSHNDTFYEAHGKFYLFKNCNNWVNHGLKAMKVKTAIWAPFPYAIMRHLR